MSIGRRFTHHMKARRVRIPVSVTRTPYRLKQGRSEIKADWENVARSPESGHDELSNDGCVVAQSTLVIEKIDVHFSRGVRESPGRSAREVPWLPRGWFHSRGERDSPGRSAREVPWLPRGWFPSRGVLEYPGLSGRKVPWRKRGWFRS